MKYGRIVSWIIALTIYNNSFAQEDLAVPRIGLNIATFCDSAEDKKGKLNLIGTFDTVTSPNYPFTLKPCCLVLRLFFTKIQDNKEHKLKIQFFKYDGSKLIRNIEAPWIIQESFEGGVVTKNMIINLSGMEIPSHGTYFIKILLGEEEIAILPLMAKKG